MKLLSFQRLKQWDTLRTGCARHDPLCLKPERFTSGEACSCGGPGWRTRGALQSFWHGCACLHRSFGL